jgi:hypothetical protein
MPLKYHRREGRGIAGLFGAVIALLPCASTAQSTRPSEADRARQVVRDLADVDPEIRRRATLQLNSLGADALDVIEAAVKSDPTPERQRRLRRSLQFLRARAVVDRRLQTRLKWELQQFLDAYDHGGLTGAAWDAPAKRGIELYLTLGLDPQHGPPAARSAALAAFKQAADAGCRDTMVMSMYQLTAGGPFGFHMGVLPADVRDTMFGRNDPKYPPVVNLVLNADYIREAEMSVIGETRQILAKILPDVAATPGLPPREFDALAHRAFYALEITHHDPTGAAEKLVEVYKKLAPNTVGPLLSESALQLHIAEDEGFGEDGGPDFWVRHKDRLKKAEAIMLTAEKIDPNDGRVAYGLFNLQGLLPPRQRDAEAFESWFKRAVEIEPDNAQNYDRKLFFLSPNWTGSAEEMLAFGRDCLKTENWRSNAPMMLVRVHEELATLSGDAQKYFTRPEVWEDVKQVYDGHLVNFPDDVKRRCEFAKYAAKCERWATANEQFKLISDAFDPGVFASKTAYDYLRRKAARLAGEATQPAKN